MAAKSHLAACLPACQRRKVCRRLISVLRYTGQIYIHTHTHHAGACGRSSTTTDPIHMPYGGVLSAANSYEPTRRGDPACSATAMGDMVQQHAAARMHATRISKRCERATLGSGGQQARCAHKYKSSNTKRVERIGCVSRLLLMWWCWWLATLRYIQQQSYFRRASPSEGMWRTTAVPPSPKDQPDVGQRRPPPATQGKKGCVSGDGRIAQCH